jgi:ElaB/YqjD/DUF883 family membrane-anchored ribosome-binding protein
MPTVARVYDNYADAVSVVKAIEADTAIAPSREISLVANENARGRDTTTETTETERESHPGTGAGVGATVGGVVGILTGLGLLAIPGVGPLVAAGWLATTLAGVGVGAAAGGLIGALVKSGVPHEQAEVFEENVRRGGTLVAVQADEADVPHIEQIMASRASRNWQTDRTTFMESGWKPSSPTA